MAEQKYTSQSDQDTMLYPAEGRVDVASGVDEEQRSAYSSHHQAKGNAPQPRRNVASATPRRADVPPVEGRVDVAGDIDEEQRNAYSSHHH